MMASRNIEFSYLLKKYFTGMQLPSVRLFWLAVVVHCSTSLVKLSSIVIGDVCQTSEGRRGVQWKLPCCVTLEHGARILRRCVHWKKALNTHFSRNAFIDAWKQKGFLSSATWVYSYEWINFLRFSNSHILILGTYGNKIFRQFHTNSSSDVVFLEWRSFSWMM